MCVQAVVVYDWKQGRMCQSFQGHNREVTKVTSILCVRTDDSVALFRAVKHFTYTYPLVSTALNSASIYLPGDVLSGQYMDL